MYLLTGVAGSRAHAVEAIAKKLTQNHRIVLMYYSDRVRVKIEAHFDLIAEAL